MQNMASQFDEMQLLGVTVCQVDVWKWTMHHFNGKKWEMIFFFGR
jgi:hypothetical protein